MYKWFKLVAPRVDIGVWMFDTRAVSISRRS
jgi:hypothetical protein